MKTLKKELVRKTIFHTRAEARDKIFEYIEMFYNSKRRHSFLDFITNITLYLTQNFLNQLSIAFNHPL